MTDRIRHRGPDDSGIYAADLVYLAHRRLSIVDLVAGRQPMTNETGSVWIVFNGEIYNHETLRGELEGAGHRYATRSDTETIIHAYEEHGTDCVHRFRGMFAFAIWDERRKVLFCARDRLGIKPFYYYWDGRLFAFASEIKALLAHPSISAQFEESVLAEYLGFGYISGEQTLFRNIRKLMPGHYLQVDLQHSSPALNVERYWDLPQQKNAYQTLSRGWEEEWVSETCTRLEESVRAHLMSDVELGVFLSGGLDSSLIAAMVRQIDQRPVKTFSVGYREAQYSELGFAADAAQTIGAQHHEIVVGREDFFGALPKLIWHEDEPLAWPSSVSLFFVAKLASEHVKVVLTGEGSDELFGGYTRYGWTLLNQKYADIYGILPQGIRARIGKAIASTRLLQPSVRRKLSHTFVGRGSSVESLLLDNFYCAFSEPEQVQLLRSGQASVYDSYLYYWNSRHDSRPLSRMLYADMKTYLVELLMKQDQMSMASSLEARVPFLDSGLVEFAATIPEKLKIRGKTHKYLLKQVARGFLPSRIVDRKKLGFPTPLRQWLRAPGAESLFSRLLADDGILASYIHMNELRRLIDAHRSGQVDGTDRLWRLLNLQIWGEIFLSGKSEPWEGTGSPYTARSVAV